MLMCSKHIRISGVINGNWTAEGDVGRVVGGVAARLLSGLRPSLRLRWPATPLEYRCQGDISISVTVYSPATNIACSQPNCEPLLNRKRRKERKDNGLLLVGL